MNISRINAAIQFLKDGESFIVEDIKLGMEGHKCIYIMGWSQVSNIDNQTKKNALKELGYIKALFSEMLEVSVDLRVFATNKKIKYILALNYRMGGIGICSEIANKVKWEVNIRD